MGRYKGHGGRGGRRGGQARGMGRAYGGYGPDVRGLYRSRRGRFLGVCLGLADYFDIPVRWVRLGAVLLIVFTGLWPGLALYFIAALVMRLEPVVPPASEPEREFYDSYARSRSDALGRIKDKFDRLERRIRRMEDQVTSKDWQWDRRMRE